MYLILGVLFIALGVLMWKKPGIFFEITEGWKYDEAADPSDLFLYSARFGGVMFLIAGIAGIIIQFIV